MSQVIDATFEDGVFKPNGKVDLADGAKVKLVRVECEPTLEQRQKAFAEFEKLIREHPIAPGGERLTREQMYDRRRY